MLQNFQSTIGCKSVPVFVFLVLILISAPLWAGETPGDQPAAPEVREGVLSEFATGVYLMESGSVREAVDHLESAWRNSGQAVAIGRRLAEGYYSLKNFTRCELIADNILGKEGADREALLLKAKVRYIKRDPSAAIDLLESINRAHGSSFEIERLLGNINYEVGNVAQALDAYKKCIQFNPYYPYIHYRYGLLMVQAQGYDEAEEAFKKAIELDPEFVEPALQLADLYAGLGKIGEAIPILEGILAEDAGNNKALISLADLYLQAGLLDQGIKLLEARRAKAPLPRDAEIIRGRLYFEAKDYEEAFIVFHGIFEYQKDSPELARILGEICLKSGDLERSREYYDAAIEIDPNDYRSYLGLFFAGSKGFSSGDSEILDLSEEERVGLLFKAGALIGEYDFDGNYLLGVSYISLDSLSAAEYYLLRAIAVKAEDQGTLLNLANVCEKLERFEDAERYVKKLHALTPDDPAICNFYGYLLAEMGKELEKAEALVRDALRGDPENGYYLDSLGWVYYQRGDYAKAVIELEKASQRVPDDPVVLEHLGDAYRALQRFDKARMAYERSSLLQDGNSDILEKIESTNQKSE